MMFSLYQLTNSHRSTYWSFQRIKDEEQVGQFHCLQNTRSETQVMQVTKLYFGIILLQEIIKVRRWIPHIGLISKVIPLKLFLDIVGPPSLKYRQPETLPEFLDYVFIMGCFSRNVRRWTTCLGYEKLIRFPVTLNISMCALASSDIASGDIVLCSSVRHLTLKVPFSTQV